MAIFDFLEGIQTGTPQRDSFVGQVQKDTNRSAGGAGIYNANIRTFSGIDRVEGTAELTATAGVSIATYGIYKSQINTGRENDQLIASSRSLGFNNQGRSSSIGVDRSTLTGDSGADTFSMSAESTKGLTAYAAGLNQTSISTNSGNDTLSVQSTASAASSTYVYAARQSNIDTDRGVDSLRFEATSTVTEGTGRSLGIGLEGSSAFGGAEEDQLSVLVDSRGPNAAAAYGISDNSALDGGNNNDTLNISANATSSGAATATAIGVRTSSFVTGGEGSDSITISAQATANRATGAIATAAAVENNNGTISSGQGNDTLILSAESQATGRAYAYGARSAQSIEGSDGNDIFELKATARSSAAKAFAYGAYRSDLFAGTRDDRITLTATASGQVGSQAYGAFESFIEGDTGNDTIKISAGGLGTFDFKDSLIKGGNDDDIIDAGIGTGTLDGGSGFDRVVLDFFNANTMNITAINSGVRISGSQAKDGTQQAWSHDIVDVEQFTIGSTPYTASSLVEAFA